jgi:hypothetical protein
MTRAVAGDGYAVFTIAEPRLNEGWDILAALPRR